MSTNNLPLSDQNFQNLPVNINPTQQQSQSYQNNPLVQQNVAIPQQNYPLLSQAAEIVATTALAESKEELTWSWFFGQLVSVRLFPAFASLIAIFMIIRYLRTIWGKMIRTHFQIYCIILSCSDFCISISGVCTVTGVFKFIDSPVLGTL